MLPNHGGTARIDKIDFDEHQPDLQRKLQRLREHATYLLGQYRINQTLHATIDQARAAIGYDSARVLKIQAWLKSHSIEALDRNENNAQAAFLNLVDELLKRAHAHGTKAEETTVRFLLNVASQRIVPRKRTRSIPLRTPLTTD